MNPRLLLTAFAGAACAVFLPLPERPANTAGQSPSPVTAIRERLSPAGIKSDDVWPQNLEEVAGMDFDECSAALEQVLQDCGLDVPPPGQQHLAVALIVRMFRSEAGAVEFLARRPVPAWLIAGAWTGLTNQFHTVPETFRRALTAMPAGMDAARRIVATLVTGDMESARAFVASMPSDWRESLRISLLQSLAAVHPLDAAHETWQKGGDVYSIAVTAARTGPLEEAVKVLQLYAADIEGTDTETALGLLYARNPDETRRLVEATGDEQLRASLSAVAAKRDPEVEAMTPLPELLREALATPGTDAASAARSLSRIAFTDPDTAKRAWLELPEGEIRDRLARALVSGLALADPESTLTWSEENCPEQSAFALGSWSENDAPAALRAVLELPESSRLRASHLRSLDHLSRVDSIDGAVGTKPVSREDFFAIICDLPPDLQNIELSFGRTLLDAYAPKE